jgi:hypothetical protein
MEEGRMWNWSRPNLSYPNIRLEGPSKIVKNVWLDGLQACGIQVTWNTEQWHSVKLTWDQCFISRVKRKLNTNLHKLQSVYSSRYQHAAEAFLRRWQSLRWSTNYPLYGTGRFISVFNKTHHCILSPRELNPVILIPHFLKIHLMLAFHLWTGLPSGRFR